MVLLASDGCDGKVHANMILRKPNVLEEVTSNSSEGQIFAAKIFEDRKSGSKDENDGNSLICHTSFQFESMSLAILLT